MATQRVEYAELPAEVRAAVEEHTGRILKAEGNTAGLNSHLSVLLHGERRTVFAKGMRSDHKWVWTQAREVELNLYVGPVAPRLLFRFDIAGWNILAFESIDGRHADFSPDSADLPKVVELLTWLGTVPTPPIELKDAAQRLASYAAPDELEHFRGEHLLHTDLNNANILMTEDGSVHMVDWGWATRGAPWLDAAYWVIWLIAFGHEPEGAEKWAAQVPSWQGTEASGLLAFARASDALWAEIAGPDPDPWSARLARAARTWHEYRASM